MISKNTLWIRNDLRFDDNTALLSAVNHCITSGEKLTIIFHINTEQLKKGVYSNDYFFSALNVFYKKIKDLGSDILFLYGSPTDAFRDFVCKYKNVKRVFFNASERGYGLKRDREVYSILKSSGIEVHRIMDKHLCSADEVLNGEGKYYRVFTPYYNKWMKRPKAKPKRLIVSELKDVLKSGFPNENKNKFTSILDGRINTFDDICGEENAFNALRRFSEDMIDDYELARDIPSVYGTSRLSHYISSGELSIRRIYDEVLKAKDTKGRETYIKELAWRDFYNMVYHVNPSQQNEEIIEKYRVIKWNNDKYLLKIWKEGLTGYPIVDAAMRQLKETGYMHNRLRMIAGSFLVKDLLLDWRLGEKYFSDMLIDYDSASNIGGWQWVASTGTDACPYFRVFNPTTQSKRYDKEGKFIKKYILELKDVPIKYVHEPSKYKEIEVYYPNKIANHKEQRLKALDMYSNFINYDYYDFDTRSEYIKRYLLYSLNSLKDSKISNLMKFHSNNKYLYFAYDIKIKDELGVIITKNTNYSDTYTKYRKKLTCLLSKTPDVGKYVNAYEHIFGYFKKQATSGEKNKFIESIKSYRLGQMSNGEIERYLFELACKYEISYIINQSILDLEG